MKKEIKKIWLKALKSGKFSPAKGSLRRTMFGKTTHCCLGVLCELYNNRVLKKRSLKDINSLKSVHGQYASDKVIKWAGLDHQTQCSLAVTNDMAPKGNKYAEVINRIKNDL